MTEIYLKYLTSPGGESDSADMLNIVNHRSSGAARGDMS